MFCRDFRSLNTFWNAGFIRAFCCSEFESSVRQLIIPNVCDPDSWNVSSDFHSSLSLKILEGWRVPKYDRKVYITVGRCVHKTVLKQGLLSFQRKYCQKSVKNGQRLQTSCKSVSVGHLVRFFLARLNKHMG